MQKIVRRARTLNQWFENQQSKKFKDVLLSGKVLTDHKNLTQDALGLTSDNVYRYQHLIEEWHSH
jgi:hypothetical protein